LFLLFWDQVLKFASFTKEASIPFFWGRGGFSFALEKGFGARLVINVIVHGLHGFETHLKLNSDYVSFLSLKIF